MSTVLAPCNLYTASVCVGHEPIIGDAYVRCSRGDDWEAELGGTLSSPANTERVAR